MVIGSIENPKPAQFLPEIPRRADERATRVRISTGRHANGFQHDSPRLFSQNSRAAHSANGTTAPPPGRGCFAKRLANGPINRQLPSRCSKNHRVSTSVDVKQSRLHSEYKRLAADRRPFKADRRDCLKCNPVTAWESHRIGKANLKTSNATISRSPSGLPLAVW